MYFRITHTCDGGVRVGPSSGCPHCLGSNSDSDRVFADIFVMEGVAGPPEPRVLPVFKETNVRSLSGNMHDHSRIGRFTVMRMEWEMYI